MSFGPDLISSDEDGLSDDNEYYAFKQKLKKIDDPFTQPAASNKKRELKDLFQDICSGRTESLFQKLENGLPVDVDLESGWTPLLLGSTLANINMLKHLIEKGANVNQSREHTTCLMYLCNINSDDEVTRKNILNCVEFLIECGADLNAQDNKRRTTIMFAAYNGHLEIVKLLLPLVDLTVEDNQKWNALFWAVDGNQPKVVELLLNKGLAIDKKDLRGDTVEDIVQLNNFIEIQNLFPKEPLDEFCDILSHNRKNFIETFDVLKKGERPQFFTDICNMLFATRSEHLISIFNDKQINFLDFLSLSDLQLKELGVNFPYQRNRILGGLYRFHKHPFQFHSLPHVDKNQLHSNINVACTVLTCIKQLVAMEASLKFVMNNSTATLNSTELKMFTYNNKQQLEHLKIVIGSFAEIADTWDSEVNCSDKITRKRRNIAWGYVGLGTATTILIFGLYISRL